jgi:hypothetical protein
LFSIFVVPIVQQPQQQQQQHPEYHAIFSWEKSKSPLCKFSNYNTMLEMIHHTWPDLKHKHLLVVEHKDFLLEVVDDESLNNLFENLGSTAYVELLVDTKCIGFSDYTTKPDLVEELLDCRICEDARFDLDRTIPDAKYLEETVVVRDELLRRIKLLDLRQASQYTMRELISPVLYGALSLVNFQNDNPMERVQLICERSPKKPITGFLAQIIVFIRKGSKLFLSLTGIRPLSNS